MINILDQEKHEIAEQIFTVFQESYAVEARLLGAKDFPPLKRSIRDLMECETSFFGFWIQKKLVGVIEIHAEVASFHIQSLVVHPTYFRQGIAGKLINFMLKLLPGNTITVETGLANEPATMLYKKFGFKEVKQYDTDYGIRKIRFALEKPN